MINIYKFFLLLFFLVNSAFSSQISLTNEEKIWIKNNPVVKVGHSSVLKPLFIKDSQGKIDGLIPELFNFFENQLNIKFEYVDNDWFRTIESLKEKKIDIIGIMNSFAAKSNGLKHIDSPFTFYSAVYAKKDTPFVINKEEDLKGLRVAYFKKLIYIDDHLKKKKDITLIKTNSSLEAFNAVLEGKADVMVGLSFDNYILIENSILEIEPRFVFEKLYGNSVIAINDEHDILISILEKLVKSLSLEEKNKILSKWAWIPKNKKRVNFTEEEKQYLKKNEPFIVQGLASFPPFNFSENGKAMGYSVDYMKLIGEYLDVDIDFTEAKPFAETLNMFKSGKIDILPHIAKNKKREEYIDYTNFKHIEYSIGISIRKDENISSMEDLKNRVIAVVNKTFIESFLKKNHPNLELLIVPSTSNAVEAVSSGKADVFIGSIPTMNFYIQKNWLNNVKTTIIDDIGLSKKVKLMIGVQKNNLILKSILEKVNKSIPHNEVVKLKEKWLNIEPDDKSFYLTKKEKEYLLKKEKITMCVLPNWLPFEQINEKGEHIGVGADIIEMISNKIDTPFELIPTKEWGDSLQGIRERKCDILPVAMDIKSRRDSMNFTKPYTKEPFVIATKSDKMFIKDSHEIGNRKIGIVKNYAFIEVLRQRNPGIKIVTVKNAKDGLEHVRNGELFGYVDTVPAIMYTIQQNSMADIKIAGKLEFDIELSMASRNDEPLLNSILQKSLDSLTQNEIRKIVGKRIVIKVDKRVDYTLLWQISLFFLLIILVVLYKNREVSSLNKKLIIATKEIQEQQLMVDKYVMILTTDLKGFITDVNEAYCKTIGYTVEELVGTRHDLIRHPDTPRETFSEMWNTISAGEIWSGEIKNLNREKDTLYFKVIIEPLFKNGIKVGYHSISKDITDKKRIEELSITDKLTKLYNRLKIDELLLKQVNIYKRYNTPFSIILFDVDNFKLINDNFGHDIGDFVLEKIAKISKNNIRNTDDIGRWGGEEFIIICTNTNSTRALILAEHLRKNIQMANFGKVGTVTVSLGVSSYLPSDNINTIFKRVDRALYQAKKDGKNCTITM